MRLVPLGSVAAVVTSGLLLGGKLGGAAAQQAPVLTVCEDELVSAGDITPAWTVASASLRAAASRPDESLELTGRTYIRDVTGDGASFSREQTTSTFGARDLPIEPAPADVLATHGFGIRDGRDYVLIAPSPAALLSHWFLAAHCVVAVRRDSTAGLEALEFVPSPALGERVGLAGTMWVDLRAETLRAVDFRYRNLSDAFIQQHASGKVEFSHHGVDIAFLARWWIRLPYRTAVVDPAGTRRPQRYLEQGGVTELAAEQPTREHPAPPTMELSPPPRLSRWSLSPPLRGPHRKRGVCEVGLACLSPMKLRLTRSRPAAAALPRLYGTSAVVFVFRPECSTPSRLPLR